MITRSEREYYARRARDEASLADRATDPAAKIAHRQMAAEYRARASGFGGPSEQVAQQPIPRPSQAG